ncbi:7fold repeat in clathrin and VPS proteins repeat-containing protein [Acanthamoeba castellanii str. Neff]|uniref:Vacuolar protein sorting-associated protein 41 homolog n=1 Tax=Acanthamoeba castellanii (strain ATCC 30010 / Neff) TaxID=1257118 RepID=L8GFE9_ACACF|nr:7fold repeat in clathrin and VPS proteins repeat-containing protein [Acanthamoeba castellanii str. Neff]ELR10906.1 7fold repeat in clathrin and VPS proteins repeat-containing protein [Acanthamoeba castellanii str. Neff]
MKQGARPGEDKEEVYEEGEDESDEEDEGEDEEPKLKYQRLGFSVLEILKDDSATCMHTLGTRTGMVYLLDFTGNMIKKYSNHSAAVNEISIDETGEYLASCSDDGRVVIHGLYSNEMVEFAYRSPILSVALDPHYARSKKRSFACGGRAGSLVLNVKGFFRSSNNVIHAAEGPIYAIAWCGSLIAWANDIGVKIYDVNTEQRITFIDRPKGSPKADLYRCSLCWEDPHTLLIGWADMERVEHTLPTAAPTRYVEIAEEYSAPQTTGAHLIDEHYFVCGIAPFGEYLCLLAYIEEEENGRKVPQPPELRIITRHNEEVSSDALTIHGYESYKATSYRLDHLASESLFYIVSPKDIVLAKPRDLDDHIAWLIDPYRARYEEALQAAEANEAQLLRHRLIDIGEKYLNHLLEKGEVAKAAELSPKILKRDGALWEKWIIEFARRRELKLKDYVYEMVLNHYLRHDHKGFYNLITEWPHTIYNIQNLITTYNLFHAIQDKVLLLIECDQDRAIKLFVDNVDKVPVKTVVQQLNDTPRIQHAYLHALFTKDPHLGEEYTLLQLKHYAEYDYKQLKPFLIQTIYPLEKAYKIVEERKLYPEMVYILGRMGNTKDALDLIIQKIGDVKQAIEFVQEQRDEELWGDLITQSMRNPKFVSGLLEHIGAFEAVNPLDLIRRIPNGMAIEGLRDRLVKIISDYNLQMSLREGCNTILKADCVDLMDRLYGGQRRAVSVSPDMHCALCSGVIIPTSVKDAGDVVAFFCNHGYHTRCLKLAIHTARGGGINNNSNADTRPEGTVENLSYNSIRAAEREMLNEENLAALRGGQLVCIICHHNKVKELKQRQQKQQAAPKDDWAY